MTIHRFFRPLPWFFLLFLIGVAMASGACRRTPDPDEFFGTGGSATGGMTGTPVGGGTAMGGGGHGVATGGVSLGGSGGEENAVDCGSPPAVTGSFSKRALLEAAALCAEWHYCDFDNAATLLGREVESFVEDPSGGNLNRARQAWLRVMDSWSRAELFQYGPAGGPTLDPYHGSGLRELIYAWPSSSRCRVEEQIANQRYASEGWDRVLTTARGIYALEYLLFYPGQDTACLGNSTAAETWAGLSSSQLEARKRNYALALSENIVDVIRELRDLWAPEGGNFRQTLIEGNGYVKPATGNDQEALNIVAWSFVYIEHQVKDWKVAHPAGLNPAAPLDGFEAPFSLRAVHALRENLRAFRSIFQGCGPNGTGLGFDDWLRFANHPDLADDIIAAYERAQAAADSFPPFHEASQAQFLELHTAVKELTDLIKNDFLAGAGSPLNLSMPAAFEGDND